MSHNQVIHDENRSINLEKDFSGSIICKKLLIPVGVKFVGHVVAEEMYVKGEFDGYAQVKAFYADETSKLDGTIVADKVRNKSNDQNIRTNTRVSMALAPMAVTPTQLEALIEAAVDSAIAEMKADDLTVEKSVDLEEPRSEAVELGREDFNVQSFVLERPKDVAALAASKRLRAERDIFANKEMVESVKTNRIEDVFADGGIRPGALPSLF